MTDKPTIVLADDNAGILEVLAKLLRPCFRIVAQCKDGDAAFKAIKEFSPRLGILDIAMPKINGLEVGRRLMAVHSSTKIVFLTLESNKEFIDAARFCEHGFVFKMLVYSDLLPALEAALRDEFFTSDFAKLRRRCD
jgi:two-component system, NarL family, nitrate/nitrite response regulator NarL